MKDYRLPENRREYFSALYNMNLQHGTHPGLVYLLMPELAAYYSWSAEDKLWFAFINGNTQNPLTSLKVFMQFPELPDTPNGCIQLYNYFNENWERLSFDTDRRYQKKEFPKAVFTYANMAKSAGSQEKLLTGTFKDLWALVMKQFHGFGRLAAFSYLEYVRIMGFGANCDDLFFGDKSGSKSHRNGALLLFGQDALVDDKRMPQEVPAYDMGLMANWLTNQTDQYLAELNSPFEHAGYFTFESQCCAFKNGFFSRRYPGVYADMMLDRIQWYDAIGESDLTEIFKDIREAKLPVWLREECDQRQTPRANKASQFALTGTAFNQEYFL